jgi:hypothetical protein
LIAVAALAWVVGRGGVAAEPASAPAEPGDLWEVTTQMSMEGVNMALPGQKQKVCSPRTWTEPPGGSQDKSCQFTDFTTSSSGATWKMKCSGPPAMTGEGEIKRTSVDAYSGIMRMTSDQGNMTVKIDGRRLGDCDAATSRHSVKQVRAEIEQQQRDVEAQVAAATAQTCADAVKAMDLQLMKSYEQICPLAQFEPMFCERLGTMEGFTSVCPRSEDKGTTLAEAAAFCKQDAEALRKRRCDELLRDESFETLGQCCPEQSSVLAERECAGRDYTTIAQTKYGGFCLTYAQETMAGAQKESAAEEATTPADPAKATEGKVKKGLKGLFRR